MKYSFCIPFISDFLNHLTADSIDSITFSDGWPQIEDAESELEKMKTEAEENNIYNDYEFGKAADVDGSEEE